MWLLDVNVPRAVSTLLGGFGIQAEHTVSRGWDGLTNGALVEIAAAQGFTCVITRDRLFGVSAARVLKSHPEFSIVLVTIRQMRGPEFLSSFRTAWEKNPIRPVPGRLVLWPSGT